MQHACIIQVYYRYWFIFYYYFIFILLSYFIIIIFIIYFYIIDWICMTWPSVLWQCWLGIWNGIQSVKLSDEVLASFWLHHNWEKMLEFSSTVLLAPSPYHVHRLRISEVQMICMSSSWCHCHTVISSFTKIHNDFTFLVLAYPACSRKQAIKRLSDLVNAHEWGTATSRVVSCFTGEETSRIVWKREYVDLITQHHDQSTYSTWIAATISHINSVSAHYQSCVYTIIIS